MNEIKAFRKANHLKQQELADYLGIGRSFISQVETGISKMPDDKLELLLNNTNGWQTYMLSEANQRLRFLVGTQKQDLILPAETEQKNIKPKEEKSAPDYYDIEQDYVRACNENAELRVEMSRMRRRMFELMEKLAKLGYPCEDNDCAL